MIKAVTIALLVCLLSRTAHAALPPCNAEDHECLLKLVLQQTNELEAERIRNAHLQRSNDLLQEALRQEEERNQAAPKIFIMGMIVGVVFVGLAGTMAMKAVKS